MGLKKGGFPQPAFYETHNKQTLNSGEQTKPNTNDYHHLKRFYDRTIYNRDKGGVEILLCLR